MSNEENCACGGYEPSDGIAHTECRRCGHWEAEHRDSGICIGETREAALRRALVANNWPNGVPR